MPEKVLLKDTLFNCKKVEQIAGEIYGVYPTFKKKDFVRDVMQAFPSLELKARITWIATCLKVHLPGDYRRAVGILIKALPAPSDPTLSDDDFGDFIYAPYSEYVARNGCTKEYLKFSLGALYETTQRSSAEDAVRYFINAFPQETIKELLKWSKDPHYHVRRLCSEGTRPKLPWSQKVNIPIAFPLPILDNLFSDTTRFVTRSVANHINDISKIDPDLAINTLMEWKKSGRQASDEMDYIVRHALRTLIKKGNPKAMNMLGFSPAAKVKMSGLMVPKAVSMNTALEFSFSLHAQEKTKVIVDYILCFQSKIGKLNSKKVYKLREVSLEKNKPFAVTKRHLLRQNMTTRKLYPGKHEIEIQVNGKICAKESFILK